jgi:hypothetical protein
MVVGGLLLSSSAFHHGVSRFIVIIISFSKVFEFLIHEHMLYYFTCKLNPGQHGSQKRSSGTGSEQTDF